MSTQYVKGNSIFNRINKVKKQYPYLTEHISCDVAIVGGGVTGAILSYYFSMHGVQTVLLEKGRIGHLSTGITTALLQYELDDNAMELENKTSLENVEKSYKLGLSAIDSIQEIINKFGNACEFERVDSVLYTAKKIEASQMKDEYEFRKKCGLDVSLISEENNPFSFPLVQGVIGKKGAAKIDPYLFTNELLQIAEQNQARIYENTEVTKLRYHEDHVDIECVYGYQVNARYVICATGYNTKLFTDRNFGVSMSTAFNIATKPITNLDAQYHNYVFRDNNDPYNYFRTTKDNRILLGGEDINFLPDIENEEACQRCYANLETKLAALFPQYEKEIAYAYCGAFASSKDNLGFIGPDDKHKRLWYCLGYGANGILFAILGAQMLVKLYNKEKDPDMKLFDVMRFDGKK